MKSGAEVEGAQGGGAKVIKAVIGDGAISPRGKKAKGKVKADIRALDGQRTKLSAWCLGMAPS